MSGATPRATARPAGVRQTGHGLRGRPTDDRLPGKILNSWGAAGGVPRSAARTALPAAEGHRRSNAAKSSRSRSFARRPSSCQSSATFSGRWRGSCSATWHGRPATERRRSSRRHWRGGCHPRLYRDRVLVAQVGLDGRLAEEQPARDVPVGPALRQQPEDFDLPDGQRGRWSAGPRRQPGGDTRGQSHLASRDVPDRAEQLGLEVAPCRGRGEVAPRLTG